METPHRVCADIYQSESYAVPIEWVHRRLAEKIASEILDKHMVSQRMEGGLTKHSLDLVVMTPGDYHREVADAARRFGVMPFAF